MCPLLWWVGSGEIVVRAVVLVGRGADEAPAAVGSVGHASVAAARAGAGAEAAAELLVAGGDGLALAKEIYAYASDHVDEFCAPYATVIDIDKRQVIRQVAVGRSPHGVWTLDHAARQ